MRWEEDKNNPIVDGDSLFGKGFRTEDSKIAKAGDNYYLATASGKDRKRMDIYLLKANSLSGPWQKVLDKPIISRGNFYDFDYRYLRLGGITFYDGTWYLYYSGQNLLREDAVGLATTLEKDFPLGWKKYKGNPILKRTGNDWESQSLLTLCLKRIGPPRKEWYGHYTAKGKDKRYHLGICYGSSPDGPFTRYVDNPILAPGKKEEWDFGGPARADFIKTPNKIYGVYESAGKQPFQIGGYWGDSIFGPFTKIFSDKPFLSGSEIGLQYANPCLWYEEGKIYLLAARKSINYREKPYWRYVDLFSLTLE